MMLLLQDPFAADPAYVIETILEACHCAVSGAGLFAFASAGGAQLLLEDKTFVSFASHCPFDLVVGVDAVTNMPAINAMTSAALRAKAMTLAFFLNERTDALFHPKFCWFRYKTGGTLIVGSGNLTIGGLRGNWEAFSVAPLNPNEINEVEQFWKTWKAKQKAVLLPPDDPRIISRASENTGWVNLVNPEDTSRRKRGGRDFGHPREEAVGPIRPDSSVLIAEIPRGGNRWTSAGFDLKNYEAFFGAKVGTQRRIVLQHVNRDGSLGDVESRPSVAVRSHNYRFELGAASGLAYPETGVPIGVFVKVATRTFRYRLLLPSDPDYSLLSKLLDEKWNGPNNEMRRVRLSVTELRHVWPDSPLWISRSTT